jgi:hypothetical protein
MQSFIRNLPKFTKESNYIVKKNNLVKIPKDITELRKELLKYEINPFDLLMKKIPDEIYSTVEIDSIPIKMKETKELLLKHVDEFYAYLKDYIKQSTDSTYKGEIGPLLKNWSKSIDKSKYEYINKKLLNKFLNYCKSINNYEEKYIVGQVGYIFTGLSIEDWNDETLKIFKNEFKESIDYINNLNVSKFEKKKTYKVIFDEDKLESKTIENIELNGLSKNLYMEILDMLVDHKDQLEDVYIQNLILKLFKKFIS